MAVNWKGDSRDTREPTSFLMQLLLPSIVKLIDQFKMTAGVD